MDRKTTIEELEKAAREAWDLWAVFEFSSREMSGQSKVAMERTVRQMLQRAKQQERACAAFAAEVRKNNAMVKCEAAIESMASIRRLVNSVKG